MSRFKQLSHTAGAVEQPVPEPKAVVTPAKPKARENKKAIVGYFSEDLSEAVRVLAIKEKTTVQALVGEGLDLLLQSRGKHRFGER